LRQRLWKLSAALFEPGCAGDASNMFPSLEYSTTQNSEMPPLQLAPSVTSSASGHAKKSRQMSQLSHAQ
jgi:hypothetical protein